MKVCKFIRLNDFIKFCEPIRLDDFFINYEVLKVYGFIKSYGPKEKFKNFTNYFLKILSQPKLVLGGDRGLFKIIKVLKFYNNLSRKWKLSLTFRNLPYIIDETIK